MSPDNQDINTDTVLQSITTRIADVGWCVQPNFIDEQLVKTLYQQSNSAWLNGEFRPAGVGRSLSYAIQPTLRNDQVHWLDPGVAQGAYVEYFARMEALRRATNRILYLGLFDFEAHLAIYPPGSFYRKHLDQFKGIGLRTLTTTLYLNTDWTAADGGQLRLYLNGDGNNEQIDILPSGGTLVCFLSADFEHEVLPANRQRLSVTGWFRRRAS